MSIVIKIKTWRCPNCDYAQDFDPDVPALMSVHFPGLPAGDCPACSLGQNPEHTKKKVAMIRETNPEKMTTVTVADEAELIAGVDIRSDEIAEQPFVDEAEAAVQSEEDAGAILLSKGERERKKKAKLDARAIEIASAKAQRRLDKKTEMDAEKAQLKAQRAASLVAMLLLEDTK